jgi:hypothetical protein
LPSYRAFAGVEAGCDQGGREVFPIGEVDRGALLWAQQGHGCDDLGPSVLGFDRLIECEVLTTASPIE